MKIINTINEQKEIKPIVMTKEKIEKRKKALEQFHKEVGKEVRENREREQTSIEYAKHNIFG
mgnify:CR=1 FL=1